MTTHDLTVTAVKSGLFYWGMVAFLILGLICICLGHKQAASAMFFLAGAWGIAVFLAPFVRAAIS